MADPIGEVMGEKFGNYELVRRIAQGGMAEVFLARFTGVEGFERWLVIKRMLPELAIRKDFVEMFLDEARLAARFNHPNIVLVHELGEKNGSYFMAMEYVDGPHLGALFAHSLRKKSPMPVSLCCYVLARAAEGLHHAHELKDRDGTPLSIVHRDVSPQNILISRDGDVKVMDFGVAKAASQTTQTRTGVVKGKVGYMSPEQCLANPVDRRTDVFALGIVLYELVTRRRLFRDKSDLVVMQKITTEEVPPPSQVNPKIPRELDELILKSLRREKDARTPDALTLSDELDTYLAGSGEAVTRNTLARWMNENATDLVPSGELVQNPTPSWTGAQSPSGGSRPGMASTAPTPPRSNDAETRALSTAHLNEGTQDETPASSGAAEGGLALPPDTPVDTGGKPAGPSRAPLVAGAVVAVVALGGTAAFFALGGLSSTGTLRPVTPTTTSGSSGQPEAPPSSAAPTPPPASAGSPATAAGGAPAPDITLGALRILVDPPQAEVTVNRVSRGTCENGAVLVDKLSMENPEAQVVLSLDGYETQRMSVPLVGGDTITLPVIRLRRQSATVRPVHGIFEITSDPSNLKVSIDGRTVGRTPLVKLEVKDGAHTIVVEAPPGYEPYRDTFKSVAGMKQSLPITLQKAARPPRDDRPREPEGTGKLVVDTTPYWTYVYLNGKNLGATPIAPPVEVPAGKVTLRLRRDGKDGCTIDVTRSVEVAANQLTRKSFTLEAREAKGTCQ
ncbi:MAG: serine/threonine protein kinase [Deltaproteobacteria bacterium]|nr:serine/threonine protein kinase [Deltaproteobacteria bacterium]